MSKVHSFRNQLVVAPVQIVCGDCAGDGLNPRATYLVERNGQTVCETCGGRSYDVKSKLDLARKIAEYRALDKIEAQS